MHKKKFLSVVQDENSSEILTTGDEIKSSPIKGRYEKISEMQNYAKITPYPAIFFYGTAELLRRFRSA